MKLTLLYFLSLVAILLGRLRMSTKDCLAQFSGVLESMFDAPKTTSMRSSLSWRQPKYYHQEFEAKIKYLVQLHDSKFPERFPDGSFGSDPFQVKT
jgi:hypothetical protein